MSKYTTEVRFICEQASGMSESAGQASVDDVLSKSVDNIFNFDFPIFDEKYRVVLEKKILKHFYTREIGEETVGLWKLRLSTKLNEIMPYYNKLYKSELIEFNPIYTQHITREYNKDGSNKSVNNSTNDTSNSGTVNSTSDVTGISNSISERWDKYSDTPQGSVDGIASDRYLTNARHNSDNDNANSKSSSSGNVSSNDTSKVVFSGNGNIDSTEKYLESVSGFDGRSGSSLLKEYRETFLNIDMMIIDELEVLFIQLW